MLPRECFVKYIIAWPPLGEAQVALALERIESAQKYGFAELFAAQFQEGVEGGERRRADAAVGDEVGIVLALAVQCRQRALKESRGHRRSHVGAGVEEFAGNGARPFRHLVELRPEPVQPLVDYRRFLTRQVAHGSTITVGAGDSLGDAEIRRPSAVGGMIGIAALPVDQRVDKVVNVHAAAPSPSRVELL